MEQKVLLVDDDCEVLQINAKYLASQGFNVKITSHPSAVMRILEDYVPDCIVLDVMMPELDGMSLCKRIRTVSQVPIIFLSGKTTEDDRIKGLMLGADDYITKPYSLRELTVRIQANLRRHMASSASSSVLSYPPLSIDTIGHKVYYNEEEVALSNREYELFLLLVNRKNEVVTFEDISRQVWGTYSESDRRSIMVNASRLRKKLEAFPGLGQMVETVWSKGYRFITK